MAAAVSGEFGAEMNQRVGKAERIRKFTFLPLLVFLLAVSYGLLTMLLVLQDRTIDAQSDLIHLLFKQRRLNAIAAQNRQTTIGKNYPRQESGAAHAPSPPFSSKIPSAQVPSQSASPSPSSQEKASAAKRGKSQHKAGRRSPFRPPAEVTDPSDMRRTLFSI
jgi:hypothetical protein